MSYQREHGTYRMVEAALASTKEVICMGGEVGFGERCVKGGQTQDAEGEGGEGCQPWDSRRGKEAS